MKCQKWLENWGAYGRQLHDTDGVYIFVLWRSGSDPLPGWKTLAEVAGQKLGFQSTLGTEEAKCELKIGLFTQS